MKHHKMNLHLTINERHSEIKYIEIGLFKTRAASIDFLRALFIFLAIFFFSFMFYFVVAFVIEDQDTMLCNSAVVSGNANYKTKCQCFYEGQDVSCIYQKEVKNK